MKATFVVAVGERVSDRRVGQPVATFPQVRGATKEALPVLLG
jgi:hypothetical protein